MKKIIITGITGQDGLFLTSKLMKLYPTAEILGVSRQKNLNTFLKNLNSLISFDEKYLKILNVDLLNPHEVEGMLEDFAPDTIFNLSGPSSVYESIHNRDIVSGKIISIFENLTSPLIKKNNFITFFQASSSEMFSPNAGRYLNENSMIDANSPYAEEKMENHFKVLKYSDEYDWNIISGIMFNHESEFRKTPYLIPKIVQSAYEISLGNSSSFEIGSLDYVRDWSFAGDIVDGIILLTKNNASGSYVIGSGEGSTIEQLVDIVFKMFDLNYQNYVKINANLLRTGDPLIKIADPSKLKREFGWSPAYGLNEMIQRCFSKFTS